MTRLDEDQSGVVSMLEFQAGLKWLTLPFNSKTFLQMRESLSKHIQSGSDRVMGAVGTNLSDLTGELENPLRKIHAASEQASMLTESARDLSLHTLSRGPQASGGVLMQREIAAMENRMSSQIDSLAGRLQRIKVVG